MGFADDEISKEEDIFTSPLEQAQQDYLNQNNSGYPIPPPVYAQPRAQTQSQIYGQPVQPKRGFLSRLFGWGQKKVMTQAKLPIEQIPKNQPEKIKDPPASLNPIVRVPEALFYGETEVPPGIYAIVLQAQTSVIQFMREDKVIVEIPIKTFPHTLQNGTIQAKPTWKPQNITGNLSSTRQAIIAKQQQAQQMTLSAQAKNEMVVIKSDSAQIEYLPNSNQAIVVYSHPVGDANSEIWKSTPIIVLH